MTAYSLPQVRAQLATYGPKTCPEIYLAFLSLDECDQEWILAHVQKLANGCRSIGAASALELLYKLGYLMVHGDRRCPCCGQPINS